MIASVPQHRDIDEMWAAFLVAIDDKRRGVSADAFGHLNGLGRPKARAALELLESAGRIVRMPGRKEGQIAWRIAPGVREPDEQNVPAEWNGRGQQHGNAA